MVMNLKLIKDVENFKDFLIDSGFGKLIPYYNEVKPFQKIYVVTKDEESIGFVELHYLSERPDLFIARQIFEEPFNNDENKLEIVNIIELKAKELGAKMITAVMVDSQAKEYESQGFVVTRKIHHIRKEI